MNKDREEFIENLKIVYVSLLMLTEDIKYPLNEQNQRFLETATQLIGAISRDILKEDIKAVIRSIGEQQGGNQ